MTLMTLSSSVFAEAPGLISQSQRSQEATLKAHGKLRKEELAAKVSEAFEGAGYLPDMLITPVRAGKFVLTSSGVAVAAE